MNARQNRILSGIGFGVAAISAILVITGGVIVIRSFEAAASRYQAFVNLNLIRVSIECYVDDHGGKLPDTSTPSLFWAQLRPYGALASNQYCNTSNANDGIWLPNPKLSHKLFAKIAHPESAVLLYQSKSVYGHRWVDVVARVGDGDPGIGPQGEFYLTESQWLKMKAASGL